MSLLLHESTFLSSWTSKSLKPASHDRLFAWSLSRRANGETACGIVFGFESLIDIRGSVVNI